MTDAKNTGRIDVWPSRADATAADTGESRVFGRMTVWPTHAAAKAHTHLGGGGSYTAQAVHFDGSAHLGIASLTATDNFDFAMAFWFKVAALNAKIVFVVDPDNSYSSYMNFSPGEEINLANSAGNKYFTIGMTPSVDAWHSLVFSGNTNAGAGSKTAKLYIDDVDVTDITADTQIAYAMAFNGLKFLVGDDTFGAGLTADIADLRVMPGVSLLDSGDIPLVTRRLFIDAGGKPVDPATATASLGAPCILFSGDSTTFATNQGTGGAFTLTGSMTNASTSPSD